MSASGTTPGPWAVEADLRCDNGYSYSDEPNGEEYTAGWNITSPTGEVVGIEGILPDGKANANLIAAAPELYEALAAMVAWANSDGNGGGYPGAQAAAALAKADGK